MNERDCLDNEAMAEFALTHGHTRTTKKDRRIQDLEAQVRELQDLLRIHALTFYAAEEEIACNECGHISKHGKDCRLAAALAER